MNLPNEDIPVRVAEDEEVEANTEYDPDCCVRNDSDENEIEHSDKDIWHDTEENDYDMMMNMGRSQLSMIRECGLVTVHLITTMKQTRLLMILLMHLLVKPKFMNLDKEVHRGPM